MSGFSRTEQRRTHRSAFVVSGYFLAGRGAYNPPMRSAAGAFFVAPLAALVVMVAFWGAGMNSEWAAILPVFSLASVGVIAQVAAPISYFWMWFFGIPAHVLLKRKGLNRWHHYAFTGMALGAGPPAFYLLYLAAYDGFQIGRAHV